MKTGYQIHVESWENDADNYKTEIISGLDEQTCRFLYHIASAFGAFAGNDHVSGGDENESVGYLRLYNEAHEKFPGVYSDYVFDGVLPTEEELELYDEYAKLGYGNARRNDPKYAAFHNKYDSDVHNFLDFWNECITAPLLSYPGDDFGDFHNYDRAVDSIKVYFVPGEIEDVTNRFI